MNDIWIFRPGALGDTILTLPFLESLQKQYAESNIIFWGSIEYAPVIDEFFPQIEFRSFQSLQLTPLFSCDFTKADLTINLPATIYVILKQDKVVLKNLNQICSQVKWCEIEERNNIWVATQIQTILNCSIDNNFSPIHKSSQNKKLLIHMGTGSPQKLLPKEFWISLIDQLKDKFSVSLLFGPADTNISSEIFKDIDIIRDISLAELMKKMKNFSYFLGLDSGVSHLAGALGLKGTAFFHHTNPQYWRPLGNIKPLIVDIHNLPSLKKDQLSILNLS